MYLITKTFLFYQWSSLNAKFACLYATILSFIVFKNIFLNIRYSKDNLEIWRFTCLICNNLLLTPSHEKMKSSLHRVLVIYKYIFSRLYQSWNWGYPSASHNYHPIPSFSPLQIFKLKSSDWLFLLSWPLLSTWTLTYTVTMVTGVYSYISSTNSFLLFHFSDVFRLKRIVCSWITGIYIYMYVCVWKKVYFKKV